MASTPRDISALPGDPGRLNLSYSHDHPARPLDFEDTLESWHVSVGYGWPGDEGDDELAEESGVPGGTEVGRLTLYRLRDFTGDDRWEAADAESGDLEAIVAAVLGGDGEYSRKFQNRIECPVGDLLILDRVYLDKSWRGFGLGPILAAEAIRRLASGCCAVAVYPGMSEYPEGCTQVTNADRKRAKKKIAAMWETIGFEKFTRNVWLLDTALRAPVDLLHARRADLASQAEAWSEAQSWQPSLV